MLLDILWMQGRTSAEILRLVDFEGVENAEAAMAAKRGILYCTAHLGNWEIHAIAHAWAYRPISAVARPLDNKALDARLCAFRTSSGNRVIYKKKALAQMVRALRAGEGVAVLLDQNVQAKDEIFAEFFGRLRRPRRRGRRIGREDRCSLIPPTRSCCPTVATG